MTSPNVTQYLEFIRAQGINSTVLPDDSPWIGASYNIAMNLTNSLLDLIPNKDPTYLSLYALAVYNLGVDRLINIAQDVTPPVYIPGTDPPITYFANLRKGFKIDSFTSGIVEATSDEGTSVKLVVPEWAMQLTMLDLQTVKTPWGRAYMAIAQQWGPSDWGLS